MRRRLITVVSALVVIVPALVTVVGVGEAAASSGSFSNTASLVLRDPNFAGNPNCSNPAVLCNATAGIYPSTISVTGFTGTISSLSVSLNNVSYSYSDDIDALLVGPSGQSLILVAAVGPNTGDSVAANNSTLTISDSGTLPTDLTPWGSAPTFKPANFGSFGLGDTKNGFNENYTSPAPAAPWGDPGQQGTNATLGNTFDGLNADGTWSLYVITTSAGDGTGAIAGGWSLNIATAAAAAPTTTALSSNNNPSFTSGAASSVTLTASVTSTSTVSAGTVDFTDGGVTIAGCGAQGVTAGQATCTTTFSTEGNHSLEALYSGTANFGASNGTVTQQVNDHTTVTGNSYCNTGSIALENPPDTVADSEPYPSRVFVSSLGGDVSHLTISLNGVTYGESQDIDALLVGPSGQSMILVSDAGPNSGGAISNVTLTLDDAAATTLTPTAVWGSPNASVTSKPVNYGGVNQTWGPPAPAGPYGNPGPSGGGTATLGSVFNGTNPNGTWNLYLITTAAGDGTGSVSGGWCANITTNNVTTTTTALSSNNNPSFTSAPGNSVTFTATVSSTSTVSEGTIDFTSDGVAISGCGAQAVIGGTATCTTSYSQEGSYSVEALYSGDATFGASNASLTQVINNHTTVTGNNFCNTGSITLNNPNINNPEIGSSPYPSNVFVTGRPGNLQHLSVTLNGVTYPESQDIDAVLVGPGGQDLILVAAAGPNSGGALSNVTLTLDDNAASTLASGSGWGAANATVTSKPVNYGGDNEIFAPPAPAGPYGNPGPFGGGTATLGSTFDGASPNGTWALYLITTAAGDGTGTVSGGWCLNLTSPAPPTLTKAFGAATIPVGATTSLSFTVTNPNASSSLSGIDFTDTLPSGLTLATPAGESGSCGGGSISAPNGGTTVSLSGATLAASAMCAFSVNVESITAGSKVNTTSTISSNEGGAGSAATATLTVVAPPVIAESFGASTIALNGTTGFTITLSNPAANTAPENGVGFIDTFPSGLVIATPSGAASNCADADIVANAGSNTVTASMILIPVNGSCTISLNVTGTSSGVKNNSVSVSSTNGGTGNTANATLDVASVPVISVSFGATSIPYGGSTSLSFTIWNPNSAGFSLTGIAFSDTLPSGLVVTTPNGLTGSCGGGAITATAGSGSITLSGATLAAGASCTFSVSVTGTSTGVKNNSVTVSSTNGGTGNTATASLTVVAPPSISAAFGAALIPLGGSTTLSFTITNPNAGTPLTGVGFTDTLPSGLVIATPSGLTGSCGGGGAITATAGSGSITLSGATLAASGTCTFSLNVIGTAAGTQVNTTSTVSSNEGGAGSAATATLTVVAPPVIAESFGASTIALNGTTGFTITLSNPAANTAPENGVGFIDTFPSGLVIATPSGAASNCADADIVANAGSNTVTASMILIPVNGSCTISLNVTGTSSGVKNNSVSVSSTNGGTGNTANATLDVASVPVISVSFGATSIPYGGSTSLSFTIWNPNSAGFSLTGIAFSDTLPSGLVVTTPNGLTGSCGGGAITATAGSGSITLSGATLAAGASCTFSVSVTGTSTGVKNNSVTVSSTNGGTGNTATASLTEKKAQLTINASSGTFVYGGAVPAITASYSGFVNGDSVTSLTHQATCSTTATSSSPVSGSPYPTTCSGAVDPNYSFTYVAGSLTETKAITGITLTSAANPTTAGSSVLFTATVTGGFNPTGSVAFYEGGNIVATIALGNGGAPANVATYSFSFLGAGDFSITARYNGDANNAASPYATTINEVVNKAPTTITVTSNNNPSGLAKAVTFTATLTGDSPTGTVTFYDGPNVIGTGTISGGVATFKTKDLQLGKHSITATYSGDANNLSTSSAALSQVVQLSEP